MVIIIFFSIDYFGRLIIRVFVYLFHLFVFPLLSMTIP